MTGSGTTYVNSAAPECEVQPFAPSASPRSQRVGKSQAHSHSGFIGGPPSIPRHTPVTAKNTGESNLQTNSLLRLEVSGRKRPLTKGGWETTKIVPVSLLRWPWSGPAAPRPAEDPPQHPLRPAGPALLVLAKELDLPRAQNSPSLPHVQGKRKRPKPRHDLLSTSTSSDL